jgi:ABC-type arginine transport system permease subunit
LNANHTIGLFLSSILAAAGLSACAAQSDASEAKAPQSLAEVYRLGSQAQGQIVQLNAHFYGWSGCSTSLQSTRSDWAIRQGDVCIYVSGSLPLGIVAPPSTASHGMPVFIHAQVVWESSSGKPHLRLLK